MTEPAKREVNWEKYTALSSMLVAACALVISIWQSYSIQQHNKLSLRPYLEMAFEYDRREGRWGLYIYNQGMGPAQVTAVQYKVDGKSYPDIVAFLIALGEAPDCYTRGNIGRFYKVEDRQVVLRTQNESCFKQEQAFNVMFNRVQIVLDYQSLYGETYQLIISLPEA